MAGTTTISTIWLFAKKKKKKKKKKLKNHKSTDVFFFFDKQDIPKNKQKQKKKQISIYQNNKINKRTDVLISGWTGDNRAPGESVMTRPV